MTHDDLALQLKLNHRNGFVHLGRQSRIHRIINILIQKLRQKQGTGILFVYLCRKHRERAQIDSVSVLQHIKAVVT